MIEREDEELVFTDEQRDSVAELLFKAVEARKLTKTQAAQKAGVPIRSLNAMLWTFPPNTSYALVTKVICSLDVPPLKINQMLGLDAPVRKWLADPEERKNYPNMAAILEGSCSFDKSLDVICGAVPEEKRDLARTLILSTLDSLNK